MRTSVQEILLLLDMSATLPVTTRVLTGIVAGMSNRALFGFNSQTNLAYVTSFYLSCGTWCLWRKKIVLVLLIWPPTPCASHLNLLADECIHTLQYFG